jgi:gas vesicle protein
MSNSKVLLGFLAGAAAGALAGLLFAPDKGSATRKKIVNKTGDITDSIKNSFTKFIDGIKETYQGVEEDVEEMSDKAGAAVSNVKRDLKNAVS